MGVGELLGLVPVDERRIYRGKWNESPTMKIFAR